MTTDICTFNVRGLANVMKRKRVFTWLKEKSLDIYLLQELHFENQSLHQWQTEWNNHAFFSGNKSNSEGVGILLGEKFGQIDIKFFEIIIGRLIAIEFILNEIPYVIINIYGPNKDDTFIFEKLRSFLLDKEDKTIIIGGDFNTVINPEIDKKNGNKNTQKKCREVIHKIKTQFNLGDIWRINNENSKSYTYRSNHKPPVFSRLDYFLVSDNIINRVKQCKIDMGYDSDHSIVLLTINNNMQQKGSGYFKLNNSLILDSIYQDNIRKTINETADLNKNANPNTLWEVIKGNIRNETIRYASFIKKENKKNEENFAKEIKEIEQKIIRETNQSLVAELTKKLEEYRSNLNKLIEQKINGTILRSKAIKVEFHEKNNKFFASLEKKNSEKKIMSQLIINDTIETDPVTILNEQKKFF